RAPRGSSPAKVQPATARECMPPGGCLPSEPLRSFPFLRRKAPEHHVQRLHFVHTEAPVSIARIDPQLPIFPPPAALVGIAVDASEKRGGSAAGVAEGYSMRAVLGRVHHIENRAALRPGKAGDGLDHAIAIVDDEANGRGLSVRPVARRSECEQDRCQQNSHRASGEAIATAPPHRPTLLSRPPLVAPSSRRGAARAGGGRAAPPPIPRGCRGARRARRPPPPAPPAG